MTITASSYGETRIFGSFQLDLGSVVPLVTKQFSPRVLINADLSTTAFPTDENVWAVQWYLNLNSGALLNNPSRFAGALPKYNLGYADFTWRGQLSNRHYWNYESQRFPTQLMWTPTVDALYPSQYIPPSPVSDADLFNFGTVLGAGIDSQYGDQVYLQWLNADPTLSNAWIYYQAYLVANIPEDSPLSLGDI